MLFWRTKISHDPNWVHDLYAINQFQERQQEKSIDASLCVHFNQKASCYNDLTASLVIQDMLDEIQKEDRKFFRNKKKIAKKLHALLTLSTSYLLFPKYTSTQILTLCKLANKHLPTIQAVLLSPLLQSIKPPYELHIEFLRKEKEFAQQVQNSPDIRAGLRSWKQSSVDEKLSLLRKIAQLKCDIWGIDIPKIGSSLHLDLNTTASYLRKDKSITINEIHLRVIKSPLKWIATISHELDHHLHAEIVQQPNICNSIITQECQDYLTLLYGRYQIYFSSQEHISLYLNSPTEQMAFEKNDLWGLYHPSVPDVLFDAIDDRITALSDQIHAQTSFHQKLLTTPYISGAKLHVK